jgi:neutral ceramidase
MTVERMLGGSSDESEVVAVDGDWETRFKWWSGSHEGHEGHEFGLSAKSHAQLSWTVPATAQSGSYRMCYFGDHKKLLTGHVTPFQGCSGLFVVN